MKLVYEDYCEIFFINNNVVFSRFFGTINSIVLIFVSIDSIT